MLERMRQRARTDEGASQYKTMAWRQRVMSPGAAIASLAPASTVFLHGAAATPPRLVEALVQRAQSQEDFRTRLVHLHLGGKEAPFLNSELQGKIASVSLFCGENVRNAVNAGVADAVPVFLSDIPGLFSRGRIRLDAALIQVSPPDQHGFCTLGTSVDGARAAVDSAKLIIAEVNPKMPRTHGNTFIHVDKIGCFVESEHELFEHQSKPETPEIARIGEFVSEIIEDGSTLQMGIGVIPDAVLSRLHHKKDLGIHTEMFSDAIVDLCNAGAITNRFKEVHPGRIVTSFVSGTRKLFDFVDDNPLVEFHPCDRTNDTNLIQKNPKVVAINSAIEIDLTGQVCADSIGHKIFSGIGGQMDFIRGAAMSRDGKPIIALPSTAAKGTVSRIVSQLSPGAGVVTTRGHVHWVATEYGIVNLHGKTFRERAQLLISISHPDFRDKLRHEVKQIRNFS